VPSDELDSTAAELVGRLAKAPTTALGLTKRLFNQSLDTDRAASFLAEAMAQELQTKSRDASEGMRAFGERRDPDYLGY
jgi:2-(1,2-epoxy-1,2-dihydrophenyl)acetyl-CoA isomerase